jgi:hypothetical protein
MQDITTVEFRKIYENKSSGLCTWELQNMDEHFRLLSDIVREQGWGESILDTARNGRINAKGKFTFRSGGGYDVVDMDLLDGTGDGRRSAVLENKYEVYVRRTLRR